MYAGESISGERFKTYMHGLDERLGEGIPRSSVILVGGEPGSMKTSFAFYILYHNGIKNGTRSAYITLEQGKNSIEQQMLNMRMDPSALADTMNIVDIGLIRKSITERTHQTWMQTFKMYVETLKETLGIEMLVIDSMTVLESLAELRNPRNDLFFFFEWLRTMNITTFLIIETGSDMELFGNYGEDFLVDAIFHLKMQIVEDVNIQRRARVVKMRETDHSTNYHLLMFDDGKFKLTNVISDDG